MLSWTYACACARNHLEAMTTLPRLRIERSVIILKLYSRRAITNHRRLRNQYGQIFRSTAEEVRIGAIVGASDKMYLDDFLGRETLLPWLEDACVSSNATWGRGLSPHSNCELNTRLVICAPVCDRAICLTLAERNSVYATSPSPDDSIATSPNKRSRIVGRGAAITSAMDIEWGEAKKKLHNRRGKATSMKSPRIYSGLTILAGTPHSNR